MSDVMIGIDTSTRVCVGVAQDDQILVSRVVGDSRSHAELLMPTVKDALAQAGLTLDQVTGIAVGMGPGPFTGLRVGIAAAMVMASVKSLPLYRICSLDVIAAQWADNARQSDDTLSTFIVSSDARRHELYWAVYDLYGRRTDGPHVSSPDGLPDLPVVGPGAMVWPQAGGGAEGILNVDAGFLAAHARSFPDAGPEPLYLRRPDAVPSVTMKSALTPEERVALPLQPVERATGAIDRGTEPGERPAVPTEGVSDDQPRL